MQLAAPKVIAAFLNAGTARNTSSSRELGYSAVSAKAAPPEAALLLPGLFGGGEGGGLGGGEEGGGFLGDAGALEEARVLGAPQPHRIGEGEGAEVVRGDVA